MGGNDISSIAQDAIAGVPVDQLLAQTEEMLGHAHTAVDWLLGDPDKFPNGVYVVFANVYEFTDFTGDVLSCPAASVAGFDANPPNPELLMASLTMINDRYMQTAAEYGADLVFMFEGFCGHGYHSGDAGSECYRGPNIENWFDLTCIHPSPTGHGELASMFLNVISE
jgi:hypothetical protein